MRRVAIGIALICLVSIAGCQNTPPEPPVLAGDGVLHYKTSRTAHTITCDDRPISLDGDRTELKLIGPCRSVVITGSHNDIALDILPAGRIAITGAHNDVTWNLIESGPRPELLNQGESNTFHRSSDGQ